jgi:hypothetical protein
MFSAFVNAMGISGKPTYYHAKGFYTTYRCGDFTTTNQSGVKSAQTEVGNENNQLFVIPGQDCEAQTDNVLTKYGYAHLPGDIRYPQPNTWYGMLGSYGFIRVQCRISYPVVNSAILMAPLTRGLLLLRYGYRGAALIGTTGCLWDNSARAAASSALSRAGPMSGSSAVVLQARPQFRPAGHRSGTHPDLQAGPVVLHVVGRLIGGQQPVGFQNSATSVGLAF